MDSSFNIPIKLDPPKQSREQQDGQQQQNHPKRPSVMERLKQLEAEMSVEAAGLRLPEDHELTEKLSTFLAAQHPEADLQIKVTSHRKTTTTKQQYETETPGMVGLPMDKLQELQRKLMAKISANKLTAVSDDSAEKKGQEEQEWERKGPPNVQQNETVEESSPVDDSQMITKKRHHILETSQSRVQGLDFPIPPATGGVKITSVRPNEREDSSVSLSLSTSSTSSNVKDKVAQFESLKGADDGAAKHRFGWRAQKPHSSSATVVEVEEKGRHHKTIDEHAIKSRIPVPEEMPPESSRHISSAEDQGKHQESAVSTGTNAKDFMNVRHVEAEKVVEDEQEGEPADSEGVDEEFQHVEEIHASQYMPFGSEVAEEKREEKDDGKPTEEGSSNVKPVIEEHPELLEEEPFKLRKISMDTEDHQQKIDELPESISDEAQIDQKKPEAIDEHFCNEGRPELFVTTGLEVRNTMEMEATRNSEIQEDQGGGVMSESAEQQQHEIPTEESAQIETSSSAPVYDFFPEPFEMQPSVWLQPVPDAENAYKAELLEERKTLLLWAEEGKNAPELIFNPKATNSWITDEASSAIDEWNEPIIDTATADQNKTKSPASSLDRGPLVDVSSGAPVADVVEEEVQYSTQTEVEDGRKSADDAIPAEYEEEEEGDEKSSTHTIIHRPLEEISSAEMQAERNEVEEGEQSQTTPTTPVMSAARWMSLDEKSSSMGSPSPIIEITPAPDEEPEQEEEQLGSADHPVTSYKKQDVVEEHQPAAAADGVTSAPDQEEELESAKAHPAQQQHVLTDETKVGDARDEKTEEAIPEAEEKGSSGMEVKEVAQKSNMEEEEIEGTDDDEDLLKEEAAPDQGESEFPPHSETIKQDSSTLSEEWKESDQLAEGRELSVQASDDQVELLVDSEPLTSTDPISSDVHFDEEGHERGGHRTPMEDDEAEYEIINKNEGPMDSEGQSFDDLVKEDTFSEATGEGRHSIDEPTLPAMAEQPSESEIAVERIEPAETGQTIKEEEKDVNESGGKRMDKEEEEESDEEILQSQQTPPENIQKIGHEEVADLVAIRQAEQLVDDAITRVLAEEMLPTPPEEDMKTKQQQQEEAPYRFLGDVSDEPVESPSPNADDWEMVASSEDAHQKPQYSGGAEQPPDNFNARIEERLDQPMIRAEPVKDDVESSEEETGFEEPELVQLQSGGRETEDAADEEVTREGRSAPPKETRHKIAGGHSLLVAEMPAFRPKSPIPPPMAATPPQTKDRERQEEEEEEEMMLFEGKDADVPQDVLILDEESEEGTKPDDRLEMLHAETLASATLLDSPTSATAEEGESSSIGAAGNSLNSSPAKKRGSSSSAPGNGNGGAASTEGSLLEFERIEQEIIDQGSTAKFEAPAAVGYGRETGDSISGSISSLTEFEQLERELCEAVSSGPIGEEVMVLSDIREESEGAMDEEGNAQEEEEEEEEEALERMSTREDDDEEEEEEENEKVGTNFEAVEREKTSKESAIENRAAIDEFAERMSSDALNLSSAGGLEADKTELQAINVPDQGMETSVDALEFERDRNRERDSLEGNVPLLVEMDHPERIDQSAQVKGNGNGSPDTNAEGEAERTVFETVRLASDGSTERLVRTAITRVHDPIHSRVRFVGTEDERSIQQVFAAGEDGRESEAVDEEGNVTRLRVEKAPAIHG